MTLQEILEQIANREIKILDGKTWYKYYNKLINIIYNVSKLTEIDLNNVVDKLDEINTLGGNQ